VSGAGLVVESDTAIGVDPDLLSQTREQMTELTTPGVALGVVHAGRSAVAGLGITSVEHPLPVDGDTLFQIGSITKTMTATALMQLVEAGTFELDTPVREALPDFAVADRHVTAQVTLRHLLTHSAGWEADVFDDFGWGDDALARMVARMATLRQATPLGSVWSYNNAAYYPLGRLLEVVYGEPFERVLARQLFAPLGMDSACFFAHEAVLCRHAVGHAIGPHGLQVARPWTMPRSTFPIGGVVASARDMVRWARFQLGVLTPPAHVLAPDTRALMHAPGLPGGTSPVGSGVRPALSWWIDERMGTPVLQHNGGANGQPASIYIAPQHDFALIVLTNSSVNGFKLADRLMRSALERHFGVTAPPQQEVSAAEFGDLGEVEGVYEGHIMRYDLRRDGDVLRLSLDMKFDWLAGLDPGWQPIRDVELRPVGPGAVATLPVAESDAMRFLRDEDGAVRWLHDTWRASERIG
jgi:CubicO group peptidase (beta-lactamase class C family)